MEGGRLLRPLGEKRKNKKNEEIEIELEIQVFGSDSLCFYVQLVVLGKVVS